MSGKAGRSGRKSKAEELGLRELLDKCVTDKQREELFIELHELATSKIRDRVKIESMKLLLAYLYGTPRQAVELSGPNGEPLEILVKGYATVSPDDFPDPKG